MSVTWELELSGPINGGWWWYTTVSDPIVYNVMSAVYFYKNGIPVTVSGEDLSGAPINTSYIRLNPGQSSRTYTISGEISDDIVVAVVGNHENGQAHGLKIKRDGVIIKELVPGALGSGAGFEPYMPPIDNDIIYDSRFNYISEHKLGYALVTKDISNTLYVTKRDNVTAVTSDGQYIVGNLAQGENATDIHPSLVGSSTTVTGYILKTDLCGNAVWANQYDTVLMESIHVYQSSVYITYGNLAGTTLFIKALNTEDGLEIWSASVSFTSTDAGRFFGYSSLSANSSGVYIGTYYRTNTNINSTFTVTSSDSSTVQSNKTNISTFTGVIFKFSHTGIAAQNYPVFMTGNIAANSVYIFDIKAIETGYYITGRLNGNSTELGITDNSTSTAFLIKYNLDGTREFIKKVAGTGAYIGYSVDANDSMVCYTGIVRTATPSLDTDISDILAQPFDVMQFIVAYDHSGQLLWANALDTYASDVGYSICIDGNNKIYLAGLFGGKSITSNNPYSTGTDTRVYYIHKDGATGQITSGIAFDTRNSKSTACLATYDLSGFVEAVRILHDYSNQLEDVAYCVHAHDGFISCQYVVDTNNVRYALIEDTIVTYVPPIPGDLIIPFRAYNNLASNYLVYSSGVLDSMVNPMFITNTRFPIVQM